MVLAIAAAGTGGHIYPGLAVAAELRRLSPDSRVIFITTRRGLGADILGRAGEEVRLVEGEPLPFRPSPRALGAGWAALRGALQARRHLREAGARGLLATGGYGSVPAVLAARSLNVPVVWHEQNVLPGRATRLVGRLAYAVALGFSEAAAYLPRRTAARVLVTGNPVRREVLTTPRVEGARRLGLDPSRFTILVMGASQGARRLNQAVVEAATELAALEGAQVLVSAGTARFGEMVEALEACCPGGRAGPDRWERGALRVVPYLADMPAALAACDLAVSRAGAISLAELTARGIPMILVPYPYAAEDHQRLNAEVMERAGAAIVVPDGELSGRRLLALIRSLAADRRRLSAMAEKSRERGLPRAAIDVAELLLQAAKAA